MECRIHSRVKLQQSMCLTTATFVLATVIWFPLVSLLPADPELNLGAQVAKILQTQFHSCHATNDVKAVN